VSCCDEGVEGGEPHVGQLMLGEQPGQHVVDRPRRLAEGERQVVESLVERLAFAALVHLSGAARTLEQPLPLLLVVLKGRRLVPPGRLHLVPAFTPTGDATPCGPTRSEPTRTVSSPKGNLGFAYPQPRFLLRTHTLWADLTPAARRD